MEEYSESAFQPLIRRIVVHILQSDSPSHLPLPSVPEKIADPGIHTRFDYPEGYRSLYGPQPAPRSGESQLSPVPSPASASCFRTVDGNNYINGVADKRARHNPGATSSLHPRSEGIPRMGAEQAPRRKRNAPCQPPADAATRAVQNGALAPSRAARSGAARANPRELSSSQWRNAILDAVTRQWCRIPPLESNYLNVLTSRRGMETHAGNDDDDNSSSGTKGRRGG